MKRHMRMFGAFLAACLLLVNAGALVSCTAPKNTDPDIVNIGVTDTLPGVNPLLLDASEIAKTVSDLQFLPLCELNNDMEVVGMLADQITTEDHVNFIVHIDANATWSDGTPVTSRDLLFSVLRYASPVIGNTSMLLYAFEGIDENTGFVAEGATVEDMTGIVALDEKTVRFTARSPMSLASFQNTYGRYIHVVPAHILEDVPESQLAGYAWFDAPTVVSGPYRITNYDRDHYISFVANENYFKGAPKIAKLNIKIVEAGQQYAGLRSGEIDFVQQTMGNIPNEDYANVEKLENVRVSYGAPVTNQSVFIQTANVSDVRVRRAILYGIDRTPLLDGLLYGCGELVDGFLSSAGPYYSDVPVPVTRDTAKAKALLAEAAADGYDISKPLDFYVNSGDAVFVNGAALMVAQLAEIGLNVKLHTVDFSTLMATAGSLDYDLLAVQYTYSPVDPYPDVAWLLSGEGSWTGYQNEELNAALEHSRLSDDADEIREDYITINSIVQRDVPMFSAYIIKAMGAVNKRLVNAEPCVYGSFINIHEWEIVSE